MVPSPAPARTGKALIDATRPFAREDRARSWLHTITTLSLLTGSIALAAFAPWWPLRIAGAVLETLVMVRAFILYHDHLHGALLRDSRLARAIFSTLGTLMLTPPRVWSDTHNFHHANTARLAARSTGTFELWTVERWRAARPLERLAYRLERHPVTMALGHVTVFLFGMCILPFAKNPRRYASSGLAVVVYAALSFAACHWLGAGVYLIAMLGPLLIAYALGSYLFYAQHNYPGVALRTEATWNHADAALEGSSYLVTSRVMAFFTGNIGYHHVHHLNSRIPFYRLPEAMAAIPELRNVATTTLHPRDVLACLRLDLWDPERGTMVRFADAEPAASAIAVAVAGS